MKRLLFLAVAIFWVAVGHAALPHKQTHLYAVKGADSLYLDHYVAAVDGVRPCVIFVFGGGFVRGERDHKDYLPYFEFLTDNGYDVFSIDYRLGLKDLSSLGDGQMRNMIGKLYSAIDMATEDLFSATAFVLDHAREWQIDRQQVVTCGSSAGAITVLQAENALCNRHPSSAVLPEGFRYAGVVSFAGAIFSLDGEPKWKQTPAPIMLFHGDADQQVPYRKATMLGVGFFGSKYLAEEFEEREWPYWFYDFKYQTHAIAGLPMYTHCREILSFLKDYVRDGRKLMTVTEVRDRELPVRETKFKVKDYLEANYAR